MDPRPATQDTLTLDPRLLNRLRGIELRSRYLVEGLYNNRHRTRSFGSSSEFIEFRQYRWGDEIRHIDWRVYGRTDRHYVRLHEMESIMRVSLLLDTSDSMRVPPTDSLPGKLDLAAVIAGAVAMMATTHQDSVGLATLGDRIEEHIPCRQGVHHLQLLFQHLARPRGKGGGNFGELLGQAAPRLRRRGVVFVLTDALDDLEPLFNGLRQLRVREHDVTLVQVLDRAEVTFPFSQMTEFRHPESHRRVVGMPMAMKARYLQRLHEHNESLAAFCRSTQVDYLRLDTASDLISLLPLHFLRRLDGMTA
ncbi:MAG: hypothetical protein BWZ02_02845 [Lentisphaerae bacterium ADurb.BinA184]|nr:MAG: hypothetical protein BWZ02_02845 [Lentisphaerae bacterium ADurb.BinA184]